MGTVIKRTNWPNEIPSTDEIDAAIREYVAAPFVYGGMNALCRKIDRKQKWVHRHMVRLGLKVPHGGRRKWSEAEIDLLAIVAHLAPASAAKRFRSAGYDRSGSQIKAQRVFQEFGRAQALEDAGFYNTCNLARLFGVGQHTITGWITHHDLKAGKRGAHNDTDGLYYSIKRSDLRNWVIAHPLRVDRKKLPDSSWLWFIDLIADASPPLSTKD